MKEGNRIVLVTILTIEIVAIAAYATTSLYNPAVCDGMWANCNGAKLDGGGRAFANLTNSTNSTPGIWFNYSIANLTNTSNISNVTVLADFWASNTDGRLRVRVSWNGGVTHGVDHIVGPATIQTRFPIEVTGDTSWTDTKLSNANFLVEATCVPVSPGLKSDCNLDWLGVSVTYN